MYVCPEFDIDFMDIDRQPDSISTLPTLPGLNNQTTSKPVWLQPNRRFLKNRRKTTFY